MQMCEINVLNNENNIIKESKINETCMNNVKILSESL